MSTTTLNTNVNKNNTVEEEDNGVKIASVIIGGILTIVALFVTIANMVQGVNKNIIENGVLTETGNSIMLSVPDFNVWGYVATAFLISVALGILTIALITIAHTDFAGFLFSAIFAVIAPIGLIVSFGLASDYPEKIPSNVVAEVLASTYGAEAVEKNTDTDTARIYSDELGGVAAFTTDYLGQNDNGYSEFILTPTNP